MEIEKFILTFLIIGTLINRDDDEKQHLQRAKKYYEEGNYKEAEKELREAIKINPNSVEAHWQLGSILHVLGRYEEAEKEYKEVIKIKPNFAPVYYNLSKLLYELGRYEEAKMEYEKAKKTSFFFKFFEIVGIIPRIEKIHGMIKTPVISASRYKICYLLFLLIVFIPITLLIIILGIMKYPHIFNNIVLGLLLVILIGVIGSILWRGEFSYWLQLFSEGNINVTPSGIKWVIKGKEGYIDFNSNFTIIRKQGRLWRGRNIVYEIQQGEQKLVFHRKVLLGEEINYLPYTESLGVHLIFHAKEITDYIEHIISQKNNDSWIYGPGFFPKDRLLEWLKNNAYDENGTRRLFRLPIVVEFKDTFRLEIKRTYIGNKKIKKSEDVILLKIDDTGMGIDFISLVRGICPRKSNICVVWIEGLWGTLIEIEPNIQKEEDNYPFTVLKVLGEVKEKNPLPMVKKRR